MRPALLRPWLRCRKLTSGLYGSSVVMAALSLTVMPRRPGLVGLYFLMPMALLLPVQVDGVVGVKGDDRLLPAWTPTVELADASQAATNDLGANALDAHAEHHLDRLADLDLVGVLVHLEDVLVLVRLQVGALLGDDRLHDDAMRDHAAASFLGALARRVSSLRRLVSEMSSLGLRRMS